MKKIKSNKGWMDCFTGLAVTARCRGLLHSIALFIPSFAMTMLVEGTAAQSLNPKVTPTSGGYATGSGNSLSWTLGETYTQTLRGGGQVLTQGFQQLYFTVRILNLKAFIQGYYIGGGQMQPALENSMVNGATGSETDTIRVELRSIADPNNVIASAVALLMTDGTASASFAGSLGGHSYWVTVKHRNTIGTWSAAPVVFSSPTTNYDFTLTSSSAFGGNLVLMDNVWAFYNGDINQDENVDLLDFPDMDFDINNGNFGYYATDLNGDGNVDLLDFPTLDANINNGVFSAHP